MGNEDYPVYEMDQLSIFEIFRIWEYSREISPSSAVMHQQQLYALRLCAVCALYVFTDASCVFCMLDFVG